MSYTVSALVTRAWYLSGIVSRDLQTVTGGQLEDGLDMLNELLAFKSADQRLIPYFTLYDFTAVVGQEKYFIPNLVKCETFTFFYGGTGNVVRYSLQEQQRKQYFGTPRVNNIQSLPGSWHLERTLNGSDLYLYFQPNIAYPLQITGKFAFGTVSLNQDLLLTYDRYYINYLRYALAEYMCAEYNIAFQTQGLQKLGEFEAVLTDISAMDLTIQKSSSMQQNAGLNWGVINISHGWVP